MSDEKSPGAPAPLPGADSLSEPITPTVPPEQVSSTTDADQVPNSVSLSAKSIPSPTIAPIESEQDRPRRLSMFMKSLARLLGLSRPELPNYLHETEIIRRLQLNSKDLVDHIHSISLRLLDGDDKRGSALDSKATSLLGAVGLSLTVAFTFGGTLLEHPERFSGIGFLGYKAIVSIYAIALISGLVAGYFALRALQIRAHRGIDEQDFLRSDVLNASETDDTGGVTYYKRYLAAHYLNVSHQNSVVYDDKAFRIQIGQRFFFLFLLGLLFIGGAIVWIAFGLSSLPPSAKATVTVEKSEPSTQGTGGSISSLRPSPPPPTPSPGDGVIAPRALFPDGGSAPAQEATTVTTPPKMPQQPVRQTSTNPPPKLPSPPPATPPPGKGREVMGNEKKTVR